MKPFKTNQGAFKQICYGLYALWRPSVVILRGHSLVWPNHFFPFVLVQGYETAFFLLCWVGVSHKRKKSGLALRDYLQHTVL